MLQGDLELFREVPVMSTAELSKSPEDVMYPESDGLPMADNSLQFSYIKLISDGLEVLYADRKDVYVIGDMFWYPVKGDNTLRQAPDTMVIFGRPKGHRGSYRQWEEGGIAPQLVLEVLSPGNRPAEMERKFKFYQRYGVEEYYVYDPDNGTLQGYLRQGDELVEQLPMQDWVSPRTGVKFRLVGKELELCRPDGERFRPFVEECLERREARQRAELERQRADQETQRADQERQRADQERQRAEQERQRAERERQRAEREKAEKALALRKAEQERAERERVLREVQEQQRQAQAQAEQLARLRARLLELGLDPDA
jgi:Uma2 family endonuclease